MSTEKPFDIPASAISFFAVRQVELRVLVLQVGVRERPRAVAGRHVRRVRGLAAVDVLDDLLPVDREVDRLANARVGPRLVLARLERHLQLAEGGVQVAQHLQAAVAPERPRRVDGQRRAVDRAGAQGRDARLLVGHHLHRHARPCTAGPSSRSCRSAPARRGRAGLKPTILYGPVPIAFAAHVDLVVEALGDDRAVALPGEEADDAGVRRRQVQPHDVLRDGGRAGDRRRARSRRRQRCRAAAGSSSS